MRRVCHPSQGGKVQLTYFDLIFPTEDVKSQIDMIGTAPPEHRTHLMKEARKLQEMTLAGVLDAPDHWTRALREIDPLLRWRWNRQRYCWTVDRLNRTDRCWTTVLDWRTFDEGPLHLSPRLLTMLREGDMQRETPEVRLARKRAEAAEIRRRNEEVHNDRVRTAVDSLSTERIRKFLEVERAMATGETIIAHAGDLAYIERQREALREALYNDELSLARRGELPPTQQNLIVEA